MQNNILNAWNNAKAKERLEFLVAICTMKYDLIKSVLDLIPVKGKKEKRS